MADYIVETVDLTKRYKSKVSVDGINIKVPECSVYGFLGPNGAGKTTTIKLLLGLMNPDKGSISVFGKSFPEKRLDILRQIGALVESPSYYGHLTGFQNLMIFAKLYGVPKSNIMDTLELVRLEKVANKTVKKYSLGMKQRLGIAIAMLHRPKLLILDEPTNGLDPSGIQEMRELIVNMPKKYGMTVLVSSHLLNEIEQVADYVGIINDGKLIHQSSLESLRQQGEGKSLESIFLEMTGSGQSL